MFFTHLVVVLLGASLVAADYALNSKFYAIDAVLILSQDDANARCNAAYPGFVAIKNTAGIWYTCIPPPTAASVCFESQYTDPRTGQPGCCPEESPFSFDPVSLNGKCCPSPEVYAWSNSSSVGDCCPDAGYSYTCGCQPTTPSICPTIGNDGSHSATIGGINYKLYCDLYPTTGVSIKPAYQSPTISTCLQDCTDDPTCKMVYYGLGGSQNGECNLVSSWTAVPDGAAPGFISGVSDPERP